MTTIKQIKAEAAAQIKAIREQRDAAIEQIRQARANHETVEVSIEQSTSLPIGIVERVELAQQIIEESIQEVVAAQEAGEARLEAEIRSTYNTPELFNLDSYELANMPYCTSEQIVACELLNQMLTQLDGFGELYKFEHHDTTTSAEIAERYGCIDGSNLSDLAGIIVECYEGETWEDGRTGNIVEARDGSYRFHALRSGNWEYEDMSTGEITFATREIYRNHLHTNAW